MHRGRAVESEDGRMLAGLGKYLDDLEHLTRPVRAWLWREKELLPSSTFIPGVIERRYRPHVAHRHDETAAIAYGKHVLAA